jgi:Flp pilus assembly protein TadG
MLERIRRRTGQPRLGSERGQALVEFALVVPLVLLLLLGIVDFGTAYNYKNDETSLANEAARFAVVNTCAPCASAGESIEQYVKNDADSGALRNGGGQIAAPGITVSICFPNGTGNIGDPLQVTVSATYKFLPYVVSLVGLPTTVTLKSTATQRIEQAYTGAYPASAYTQTAC